MKYFALRGHFDIYSDSSREDLKKRLSQKGFRYIEPQIGGGGGAVQTITIVWITLKPILGAIFLNILASVIYDVLENIYKWHKEQKQIKSKYKPDIGVTIKHGLFFKKTTYISFRVDKETTYQQVLQEVKKALKRR